MTKQALNFEDFKAEKLSRKQQKTVHGGDDPIEPTKQDGKGATKP